MISPSDSIYLYTLIPSSVALVSLSGFLFLSLSLSLSVEYMFDSPNPLQRCFRGKQIRPMGLKSILGEQKILIYISADVLYSSFSIHVFDVLSEQGCGGARIKPN